MKRGSESILERYIEKHSFLKEIETPIRDALDLLESTYRNGGKLLVCGNGGSCADADHIVGELVKSFRIRRPLDAVTVAALKARGTEASLLAEKLEGGLPAINLGAHSALVTALINDVGPDYVYAQQVIGYGKPEDVLLGISTSGNSKNVLVAVEAAKALGMKTIGMTGRDGGKMRTCCDILICAEADATEDIQDIHSTIYHVVCAVLENQFWGDH